LINPPNFLLMDEPTTHLDMASIEALMEALRQYEGTLVFISHDVYFIQSIATSVLHVRGGQLTFYPGDYDYYLHKTGTESAVAGLVADDKPAPAESTGPAAKAKDQKRIDAEERKRRSQVRQKFARELSSIESKILELELRQKELATFLEQSSDSSVRLTPAQVSRELASVTQELHTLSREWERMVDQTEI
jgi:ATP-binding cassette subfamily F protein 3